MIVLGLALVAASASTPTTDRVRKVPTVQGVKAEEKVKISGPQMRMNDVRLQTAWKMDDVRVRQLALIVREASAGDRSVTPAFLTSACGFRS